MTISILIFIVIVFAYVIWNPKFSWNTPKDIGHQYTIKFDRPFYVLCKLKKFWKFTWWSHIYHHGVLDFVEDKLKELQDEHG